MVCDIFTPLGCLQLFIQYFQFVVMRCCLSNQNIAVTARPLSPPPPLMTLATRHPPGRRRSESPAFPPVPSLPPSLPAAAPVSEACQSRCSGGAVITRQAAQRLAPAHNRESPASLQRPVRRSTRRQDFP